MNTCILDEYTSHNKNFKFGDVLLFQEYTPIPTSHPKNTKMQVSKPILAVYIKMDVYDQTIGFDYVKWIKDANGKSSTINTHVEWSDSINILGHWDTMPSFRELLKAYRKYEIKDSVSADDIYMDENEYLKYKRKLKLNKIAR